MALKIIKDIEGKLLTLRLSGRLDTMTSQEFDKYFSDSIDNVKDVILDFSELEYISSAGLRSLLQAKRIIAKQNGNIKIVHANQVVREVFNLSHFNDHITIED